MIREAALLHNKETVIIVLAISLHVIYATYAWVCMVSIEEKQGNPTQMSWLETLFCPEKDQKIPPTWHLGECLD